MSKLRYGEDCIFLDAARRKFLEGCGECLKAGWLLLRRIKSMYGKGLTASTYLALTKQREKIDWIIAGLEDFKDYMEEEEAWAPREEPSPEPAAAMDELLEAIGGKDAK